jgi:hypothetical protein
MMLVSLPTHMSSDHYRAGTCVDIATSVITWRQTNLHKRQTTPVEYTVASSPVAYHSQHPPIFCPMRARATLDHAFNFGS